MANENHALQIAVEQSRMDLPRIAAIGAGTYAVVAGTVTLLGWTLDIPRLADWLNTGIAMFANTAVCATLSGVGLILLVSGSVGLNRHRAIRVVALLVALIGGFTLFEHISGVNLGIDSLLFNRPWGQRAAASPNRMGPPASTSFLILGMALFLTTGDSRSRRQALALANVPIAIASLSLIGYWFGSDRLYTVVHLTGIAFQTSSIIAALAVGMMTAIPEHGLVALMSRNDPGGMLVRRLLLPIIIIPLVISWLRVLGQRAGYYDTAFGTSMTLLTTVAMLLALLTWTAFGLSRVAQAAEQSQSELEAVLRRDIAERKRTEDELRHAEERMRSVVDHVVDGIITIDERGNIESFNPAAEKLFGYQRGEVIGCNIKMLMPEPYHSQHDGYVANYLTSGHAKIIGIGREVVGKRKDGSTFPMDLAVSEFHLKDRRYFTGIVRDISERKQAENDLRKLASDLSEADRRKTEFLATLGHELRNPLAPIRTGLELLKVVADDPAQMEETRTMMEKQIQQMVRLIDDLLDVSRITQDKLALRTCRVVLAEVIQNAVETSRPFIDEAAHQLKVTLPQQTVYLEADPNRLAQVVSNLLINSAKYTPQEGKIWLSAEQAGEEVIIAIKDDGIGIPTEMQDRLFEMFNQIDRPLEQGHKGLGIGLTLVKRLVEMHGGMIEVRSEGTNRGSEFKVRLPILAESLPREPKATQKDVAVNTKGLRVLVVDDNTAAAKMLSSIIRMMGNEVRIANDGQEAIERAGDFLPDVVFMDLGMPRMNGYEAAGHIRKQPWGEKMMLVALTGWGQEEDKRRTKEAGFNYHLVKPAESVELQKLLSLAEDRRYDASRRSLPMQ